MIYVGDKIFINPFSDRDFVQNYRVEGFHANKVVLDDIAGAICAQGLDVTKVYAIGARADLEQALETICPLPGITITSSGSDNFEVMPARCGQGHGATSAGKAVRRCAGRNGGHRGQRQRRGHAARGRYAGGDGQRRP